MPTSLEEYRLITQMIPEINGSSQGSVYIRKKPRLLAESGARCDYPVRWCRCAMEMQDDI